MLDGLRSIPTYAEYKHYHIVSVPKQLRAPAASHEPLPAIGGTFGFGTLHRDFDSSDTTFDIVPHGNVQTDEGRLSMLLFLLLGFTFPIVREFSATMIITDARQQKGNPSTDSYCLEN